MILICTGRNHLKSDFPTAAAKPRSALNPLAAAPMVVGRMEEEKGISDHLKKDARIFHKA